MINFSLIIPTKNQTNLLERCLDSIPCRPDLEIIIVDDDSSQDVVNFANYPGLNRPNTKVVFTKAGRGAGYARNMGVMAASGKWLLFADSDDLYTDKIALLFNKYESVENVDMVIFNASLYYEKNSATVPMVYDRYIKNYLENKNYSEKILRYSVWAPWVRLVKRSIVIENHLYFEEIPIGNDMMFGLNCGKYSKTLAVELDVCYLYFVSEHGSITAQRYKDISALEDTLLLLDRANKLFREQNYIFGHSFILAYFANGKHFDDKRLYRKGYLEVVKNLHINYLLDIFYFFSHYIGRVLGIL